MKKQRIQTALSAAIIASETSHVFCCVLPTVFSVLSLLAGLGMAGAVPHWMEEFHEILHKYEMPLILTSASVLAFGWALHLYSSRIDCHDTGCKHGNCKPKKTRTGTILQIASLLFFINIAIYGVLHLGMGVFTPDAAHSS